MTEKSKVQTAKNILNDIYRYALCKNNHIPSDDGTSLLFVVIICAVAWVLIFELLPSFSLNFIFFIVFVFSSNVIVKKYLKPNKDYDSKINILLLRYEPYVIDIDGFNKFKDEVKRDFYLNPDILIRWIRWELHLINEPDIRENFKNKMTSFYKEDSK